MSIYIVAEAGVNHNGNVELAKRLIDMAAIAGANAIKFQTFRADECIGKYADKADYQKKETGQESQYEMAKRLELPFDVFFELKEYALNAGIEFISTPDGEDSLACLLELDLPLIKISSTEVTNHYFLKEIAKTKKKIVLSTGMSTLGEVEKAIDVIKNAGNDNIILLHCTTAYPTDYDEVNIKAMDTMKKAFGLEVGFSDHTLSSEAAILAVALGAQYIEKHITLDKNMYGPDHRASMNEEEFINYVKAIRRAELALGDGIKKPSKEENKNISLVRRSVVAKTHICKGSIIKKEMLSFKRPGNGISPEFIDIIEGMRVNRDIQEDDIIQWNDLKG